MTGHLMKADCRDYLPLETDADQYSDDMKDTSTALSPSCALLPSAHSLGASRSLPEADLGRDGNFDAMSNKSRN